MTRNSHTTFPVWQMVVQLSSLAFMLVLLFFPSASAEVVTPTALPTSIDDARGLLPPTPDAGAALNDSRAQAERQVTGLIPSPPATLPRSLESALGGQSSSTVGSYAESRARRGLQDDLASAGLPAVASNGDISSLLSSGPQDPATLAGIASRIDGIYAGHYVGAITVGSLNQWVLGVQASADCSTSNDNGKDLCSALEKLDQKIKEVNDQVSATLTKARRLQSMVSNKAANLNTVSRVPICLGLLTPGPGVAYTPVTLAPASTPYNSSARLVSVATIAELFRGATGAPSTPRPPTTSADPLTNIVGSSDTGAAAHVNTLAAQQQVYDTTYLRAVDNLDQTLRGRFELLEKRSDELGKLTTILKNITQALTLRPVTP